MVKILVIQTAFIGDVVLATALLEKLHHNFPEAELDFLVRKGNESLLNDHPFIHEVIVWDKKNQKYRNLFRVLRRIRGNRYDRVINVQRFAATGFLTVFSRARESFGFRKNPWSSLFSRAIAHDIAGNNQPIHEIQRNDRLLESFCRPGLFKPVLYPSAKDEQGVAPFKQSGPYITISSASVWFTKQFPAEKWIDFLDHLPPGYTVYLLGAATDEKMAGQIASHTRYQSVQNLCGKLSFLQSAALMKNAVMNYVNDSAPLHFASAVNAPVTAIYCSTLPAFGFGPLSDHRFVIETDEKLTCRPCGLHGQKKCPEGHFKCAFGIQSRQLLATLPSG